MSKELQRLDKGFRGFLNAMTMTNIERTNSINRNIVEYKPCNIDAFFKPENGVYNALLSGGDKKLRTSAMVAQAICAIHNGFPVVILHEGNRLLEQQLMSNFLSVGKYEEISCSNPCFEPFYGLNALEISNQIMETAPIDYEIKRNVRHYVDGISTLLKASGKNHSFELFSSCPHHMIFNKVNDLKIQNKIDNNEAQEIKLKLKLGQSESYKLEAFLAAMKTEMEPLLYAPRQGYNPMNVMKALKSNLVLCIDLLSVTNQLLLNTIIYQLKYALSRGMQYQLIIDSIPLNNNGYYTSYICTPSNRVCVTLAANDLFTLIGGNKNIFSALAGKSHIIVVMNHSSDQSAERWAEFFGQYEKIEQSISTSYEESRQTPFTLLPSLNFNRMVNINKKYEYVVKPDVIKRMRNGEAYVLSAALGELAHLQFTN